jgi:lysophospholipase L1-like esterase
MLNGFFSKTAGFTAFTCALLVTAFFSLTSCGGSSSDSSNYTIVCFGDSITEGMSAVTPGVVDKTKSYPAYFQEKVTADVINSGVSGDTTDDALARIQTDLLDKDPDIVIICLGANDFFASEPEDLDATLATIKTNIQSMITQLDTKERIVFVVPFYNEASARDMLTDKEITDASEQDEIIDKCDTVFEDIKNTPTTNLYDIELIDDIWTGVWGTANMSTDGIHPKASGYQIMADTYFSWMREYLEELGVVK